MDGLVLLSALWCRYCFGITESGAVIEANDPNWGKLQAQAILARDNPVAWLEMSEIYGDLAQDAALVARFTAALNAVWAKGTRQVLTDYLAA